MNKQLLRKRTIPAFSIVMVVSTITLVGLVAFQFLDAQNTTQIAQVPETAATKQVAPAEPETITTPADIDTVTEQLDVSELDTLDAELSAEFDF